MNSDFTTDFILAWESMDLEVILEFFTEDAIYANIPMGPPNTGKEEIRKFISGFLESVSELDFKVHNQIEGSNGIVMNERTDTLNFHGKVVKLPVMGIFEFRDGKICAWRDYFDMAQFAGLDSK